MTRTTGHGWFKAFGVVAVLGAALLAQSSNAFGAIDQTEVGWVNVAYLTPQLDRNGNLLVLGGDSQLGSPILTKYDPQGNTVWSTTMPASAPAPDGNSGPFLDTTAHISVDASNNIYIDTVYGSSAFVVTKINANGTVAWGGAGKTYSLAPVTPQEHTGISTMAFGSDGSLYVAAHSGQNGSGPLGNPVTILRIDPATGAERNRKGVGSTLDYSNTFHSSALVTDSSGNVYYGAPEGLWSFSQDLQTLRWNKPLMARSLAVDSASGAIYVTGVGSGGGLLYNMFVSRLSTATGATVWTFSTGNESHPYAYPLTVFDSSFPWLDARLYGGNGILVDSAGQVYAAGYGVDGSYHGGLVSKFDRSTGVKLWTRHYGPSGANAGVFALALDNLSNVYVSGQETGKRQTPFVFAELMILSPTDGTVSWSTSAVNKWDLPGMTAQEFNSVLVDGNGKTYWNEFRGDILPISSEFFLFRFSGTAIPDGTYTITGLNSGMALDDPGSSGNTGVQMDQWTVNNGANQKWTLTNVGNNTVRLVNQASGLTLGVRSGSTSNGAVVEQNVWNNATSQQWVVTSTSVLGYFTLKNLKSGQMLDVVGASKNTGALIDQWPSNNGANQRWRFQ
jgi:hypothetical protein